MKTSFSALSGLAIAAVLGISLTACGGGGGSNAVPTTTTPANPLQASSNGSVPISALDLMHPATSVPVNVTSRTPASPTVDVGDRATVAVTMSQTAGDSSLTALSQHSFAGALKGQQTASLHRSASDVAVNSPNDLSYHGGVVLGSAVQHNMFINYDAPTRQGNNFAPGRFETELNNDQFITLLYQYLTGGPNGGPNTAISTPVTGAYTKGVGGDVTDTYQANPLGNTCGNGSQACTNNYYGQRKIVLAVLAAASSTGGGSGYGQIYHVFLNKNVDTCFENINTGVPNGQCYSPDQPRFNNFVFCAYHGSFTAGPNLYLYTVEPYQDVNGCRNNVHNAPLPQATQSNGDPADPGYSTLSHELFETITDPRGNAWWNQFSNGQEIGDICAEFDNFVTVGSSQVADRYVLQSEYSDIDHLCVSANLSANTGPQTPQSAHRAVH